MLKTVAAALVALAATACGGGGGSASPPVQAVSVQRAVLIEAYGDSTVAGYNGKVGPNGDPGWVAGSLVNPRSEVANLQWLLQQRFGPEVTAHNMGVGGTTSDDLLDGTNTIPTPWAQQMALSKAQIVTIKFGINDAYARASPEDFARNITRVVAIARAAGKTVILETSNPLDNNHNPDLSALLDAERAAAKSMGVPVVDNYARFAAMSNWPSLLVDTVHPTDDGYAIEGETSFQVVAPVVEAIR